MLDHIFTDIKVGDWVAYVYGNHQLGIGTVTKIRGSDLKIHKEHNSSGLLDFLMLPGDCIVITNLAKNDRLKFNRRYDYQNSIFFDIAGQQVEENDWVFYYDTSFGDVSINKVSKISPLGVTMRDNRKVFRPNGGWYSSYQIIKVSELPSLFRYLMEKPS